MADLKLKFKMPDDETLAKYIPIKGEKGERGDPTKTSQLQNDSDFTTNTALQAGLATKADKTTVQSLSNQVETNKADIEKVNHRKIIDRFYTGPSPKYALLTTLWARGNLESAGSIVIHGRIGGFIASEVAHVDITIATRNSIRVRGSYFRSETEPTNIVDIRVYHNDNGTDSIYLYAKGYVAVNIDISPMSPLLFLFDGNWSSDEPSGTLEYSLLADDTFVQKNIAGTINADIAGDASTVNGHTVEADVPFGAVFTDTIYNDSAIRAELDEKADTTEVASQYATKTEVQSLASGAPLVASSTSEMTDTTRVYVNTSDGNWYYYNGSAWVSGGVYQATGIANIADSNISEKAIMPRSLANYGRFNRRTQTHWGYTYDRSGMSINPNGHIDSVSENYRTVTCKIPPESFITVKKTVSTNRFRVATIPITAPAGGVACDIIFDDATKQEFTFFNAEDSWVCVQYTTAGESADVDILVDNISLVRNAVRSKNLSIMEKVDSTNLYNASNKVIGEGTGTQSQQYIYKVDTTFRTYRFILEPNTTYTITKTGGNKFCVCLWNEEPLRRDDDHPDTAGQNKYLMRPSKIVTDDDSLTETIFNSENYVWCTILYSNDGTDASFVITNDANEKYRLARQYIEDYLGETLVPVDGGYQINGEPNPDNAIWSQWNGRLAWGMYPNTAPVPAQFNGQLYANGTIITHNTFDRNHNRHRFHVFEAFSKDNYSRLTILLDKHEDEFNGKGSCEQYYYTGANHYASSYSYMKLGSDVKYHSFNFDRDEMIASGHIDCRFPITLARISPANDIDGTYETAEAADRAHEPENQAEANLKCLKYIYLKNAENGCMWYDTDRDKVVVKINGEWHDLATAPVPDGTYDF